jgi:hypothetical protein
MRAMRRGVAVAAALVALLAAAPAALARTLTARAGTVRATLTLKGRSPGAPAQRLTITRAGKVSYDQPVGSTFCGTFCLASTGSLRILDLEPGHRDVVLDLFSGGAHCCTIVQIFSYDPGAKAYVETERNFGDPGVRFPDLRRNGRHQLLTADDSFAYEFTSFAASGLPIEILTFSRGRFTNVTRRYPKLIARDAAVWLSAFKSTAPSYQGSTGLIAAWAADEDLLGRSKLVAQYLSQQARAGHLKSGGPGIWPSGKGFVTKLQRFLRAHGYRR